MITETPLFDIPNVIQKWVGTDSYMRKIILRRIHAVFATLSTSLISDIINHVICAYDESPFNINDCSVINHRWKRLKIRLDDTVRTSNEYDEEFGRDEVRLIVNWHQEWMNLEIHLYVITTRDLAGDDVRTELRVKTEGMYDPMRDSRCFNLERSQNLSEYGAAWVVAVESFEKPLLRLYNIDSELKLEIKALLGVCRAILEAFSLDQKTKANEAR